MTKKHIVSFGYCDYAFDSVTAATTAVAILAKFKPVKFCTDGESKNWHYRPAEEDRRDEVKLEMNQPYRDSAAKPEKAAKPLALPKPARGTIRCICEKSDVAPRQSCTHCGRPFSESHNRTHGTKDTGPHLRLL